MKPECFHSKYYGGHILCLPVVITLLLALLTSTEARAADCGDPGAVVDCPVNVITAPPGPAIAPPSNTLLTPFDSGFAFDLGADGIPATCFHTTGEILAATGSRLVVPTVTIDEVQLFTAAPSIENIVAGVITPFAIKGSELHAAGMSCLQNQQLKPGPMPGSVIKVANVFAVTDEAIGSLVDGTYLEFPFPAEVTPVSAGGVGVCDTVAVIFDLIVQLSDDTLFVVEGGTLAVFAIPNPIEGFPVTYTTGLVGGVVVFAGSNYYTISGGTMTADPLPGAVTGPPVVVIGGVQVPTTGGPFFLSLLSPVPFFDITLPMAASAPAALCAPPATISMNVPPCNPPLQLIEATDAGWPAQGVSCVTPSVCGDGMLTKPPEGCEVDSDCPAGETCDDNCVCSITPPPLPVCGNKIVEAPAEQCEYDIHCPGHQTCAVPPCVCVGNVGFVPTFVELASLNVLVQNGNVVVNWTTGAEIDNAGFNILRSDNKDGPFSKVNDSLILAKAIPPGGADYTFVDDGAEYGSTYFYKLEDVDLDGTKTEHGPIEIEVVEGASAFLGISTVEAESSDGTGSESQAEAESDSQPASRGSGSGCSVMTSRSGQIDIGLAGLLSVLFAFGVWRVVGRGATGHAK